MEGDWSRGLGQLIEGSLANEGHALPSGVVVRGNEGSFLYVVFCVCDRKAFSCDRRADRLGINWNWYSLESYRRRFPGRGRSRGRGKRQVIG